MSLEINQGRVYMSFNGVRKSFSRFVMEQHLGRSLSSEEYVHHIDSNTLNDNLSNLKVISHPEHTSLHHAGRVVSEEHKRSLSKTHLGKIISAETREKIRQANLGKVTSEETKRKISQAGKERWERRRE